MKKIASLLLVSVFAGAITLGAYKLFFEEENYKFVTSEQETPFVTTSNMGTSAKGAGINEADFTLAAEKTVNSVVHVKNLTISKGPSSIADFFYGFERQQTPQVGTGSGVIISPDGYIVTNNHVIANSSQLEVTLNNNKSYEAEVIGTDADSDIALLKIDAEEELPYLAFGDSDNTKIGEWVLAVGNPFNLTSTVTAGIVSAKARSLSPRRAQSFIQTDAAVNPGNSGGALVNTNGDLIGINTAITSQTGSYVGYAFAVPSNIAKKVVEDIMEFGNVQKGLLGIRGGDLNPEVATEMGIDDLEGVYIASVEEESGAEEAGLKEGDIIKQVDNIQVSKFSQLTGYLSSKRPGDKVEVTLNRDGKSLVKNVVLKKQLSVVLPATGFTVKNLSKKDRKTFGVSKGVKITNVPESYSRYGLINKVIIELDGEPINNIDDAKERFGQLSRYGRTSFTMINENGEKEHMILQ
ncbi:trypsin-like peptidase domain-containing protein [Flagellimonas halotolerans]|uniref:Trypsin-like peptidase domain-containing protein n=1 Tax=Flagellimonas halotolerans TaxID=3112164 RepID=A0ABU6IUY1_9FLAO|nr:MULTISPECIES: trypsin-like peptidase domain-containing protein [unclassified Allomuricauda]MEC3966894.1 trypsin-like peptidase domain-containing protein [Muricauda sp. SYSU M86414]MEC4266787.1 trypsin-like peptidase domain-containing protein [Muricauda sp. SYSU M84420]